MSFSLGQAILELSANTARFTSDLGRALSAAEKFKRDADRALKAVGATLSVGALALFVKHSIDAADRLNDLRTQTGLTGQQLLVMEGAAVRSGAQLETVGDVASKLSKRLNDARKGTGDAAAAYKAMGISVTDASGKLKNQDVILKEVGDKFRTYEEGAQKGALATAALGKGGDKLIGFVEALREMEERFKKLGITIDEDFIDAADEFNDKLEDMKAVSMVFGRAIATALLPALNNTVEVLLEFQKNAGLVRGAVDAILLPVKLGASLFIGFAGAVASASEELVTHVLVLDKLRQLDIPGALDEWRIGQERVRDTLGKTGDMLAALWRTQEQAAKKAKEQRGPAPGIPDLEAAKKAADALQKLLDARAKIEIEQTKDAAERKQQILEREYQWGYLAERTYWGQKLALQQNAMRDELKTLDIQISRKQKEVKDAAAGTKERYDAERELEEVVAKRAKTEADLAHAGVMNAHDAADALQRYQDQVSQVEAEFRELAGETERALGIRQDISNRTLRKKLMSEGDQAGMKLLNNLETAQRAVAKFNETREESELIGQRLQIQEDRIQNSLRTGAISEFEALTRTSDARRRAADEMERFVRALEQQAAENPMLKGIQIQAEQARASLERLRSESDLLADKFNGVIKDSFSDAFSEFVNGTMTAKEAFASFTKSVLKNINDILAKHFAQQLFKGLGVTGSGGVGGWIAGLLGGGGSTATALSGPGGFDQGGLGLDEIARRFGVGVQGSAASGLDFVPRTGVYMLHQGEGVLTKQENAGPRMAPAVIINVTTPNADSFRATKRQIAAEYARALG